MALATGVFLGAAFPTRAPAAFHSPASSCSDFCEEIQKIFSARSDGFRGLLTGERTSMGGLAVNVYFPRFGRQPDCGVTQGYRTADGREVDYLLCTFSAISPMTFSSMASDFLRAAPPGLRASDQATAEAVSVRDESIHDPQATFQGLVFMGESTGPNTVLRIYSTPHAPRAAAAPPPVVQAPAAPEPQAAPSPAPASSGSDVDEPAYKSSAQHPDDFALVIGISQYRDIPPAEYAENDAKAMRRHLMALGYPEENIIMLLGDHATNASMIQKLERWLPMNVTSDSNLFVFYSGHGAPDPGSRQAYLVPWDGAPSDLADTAFPLSRFYKDLQRLKAKRIIVALDSCFSGAGGRSVLAKGARPLITKIDTAVPDQGKLIVFTASKADQISGALQDKGHGAFTYFFLQGLNGDAVTGGPGGPVTVESLYSFVSKRVSAAAHREEREQDPQLLPPGASQRQLRLR